MKINFINKNVMNKMSRTLSKFGRTVSHHMPDILTAAGITTGVATVVMACVETSKMTPILDNAKEKIDEIHRTTSFLIEESDEDDGSNADEAAIISESKKQLTDVYVHTAIDFAKLYWPSISMGMLSVACVLTGHNMMSKRNLALTTAYNTLNGAFVSYRKRVVDRYGSDVDRELYTGTHTKEIIDSETGEVTTVKEFDNGVQPGYLYTFAPETSRYWDTNENYSIVQINNAQHYANALLQMRGYVFLNEVLNELGMDWDERGQIVGWVADDTRGDSDGYIDLRCDPIVRKNDNGIEETIFNLDPNVDGVIADKFKMYIKHPAKARHRN